MLFARSETPRRPDLRKEETQPFYVHKHGCGRQRFLSQELRELLGDGRRYKYHQILSPSDRGVSLVGLVSSFSHSRRWDTIAIVTRGFVQRMLCRMLAEPGSYLFPQLPSWRHPAKNVIR
jgi:hypothetical protein